MLLEDIKKWKVTDTKQEIHQFSGFIISSPRFFMNLREMILKITIMLATKGKNIKASELFVNLFNKTKEKVVRNCYKHECVEMKKRFYLFLDSSNIS
jgi:hypothetical protein